MFALAPEWTRPSSILFAADCPADDRVFTYALAQAKESHASLTLLHVCDLAAKAAVRDASLQTFTRAKLQQLEPMVQHAAELGVRCRAEIRVGHPSDEILRFLRDERFDRVIMGAHTPGPIGKLLVGSVTETVLRKAGLPVTVVGPYLRRGTYRDYFTHTILCGVSSHPSRETVARFAAELALRHRAELVLHSTILPQDCHRPRSRDFFSAMEEEILDLISPKTRAKLTVRAAVVLGDPTEELLYFGRVTRANLIVMGAHNVSHFAAASNSGVVYKVLAYAHCPVLTLSPVVLAGFGPVSEPLPPFQINYLPGVV